jgi:hypothetical protein
MEIPASTVRLAFVGALIVMAILTMAAAALVSWLVERRRARRFQMARDAALTPRAVPTGTRPEPVSRREGPALDETRRAA